MKITDFTGQDDAFSPADTFDFVKTGVVPKGATRYQVFKQGKGMHEKGFGHFTEGKEGGGYRSRGQVVINRVQVFIIGDQVNFSLPVNEEAKTAGGLVGIRLILSKFLKKLLQAFFCR